MKEQLKYFIFNKDKDYSKGFLEGIEYDREGIWLSQTTKNGRGIFISKILDSKEKDMEWHRLVFDMNRDDYTSYKVTVFASNNTKYVFEGKEYDIREVSENMQFSFEEKRNQFFPFIKKQETGNCDILLHGVFGRYLWIAFELFRHEGQSVKLKHIRIYFPKKSFISYLPEVYQTSDTNHFLERYLAIFQTLHEEMNQKIREVPEMLDVDVAGREFLLWLSEWLDIAGSYMWSEEQLRVLLRNGVHLYKRRGTREGMLAFIRLYTGGDAYLVEFHELEPYMSDAVKKESLLRLYGNSPYILSILIKKEYVPTQKEYKSLLRVIDEIKPAQIKSNLIVLEPYMFLGGHTYLEINSSFGEYRNLTLDGLSMLPFSRIIWESDANLSEGGNK